MSFEYLTVARGKEDSMITFVIPPKEDLLRINRWLANEYDFANNIKSNENKLSMQNAIMLTQQKLNLYSHIPNNGLVLFCGTALDNDEKEITINVDFEPFQPINTKYYICDNKFYTEVLNEILDQKINNNNYKYILLYLFKLKNIHLNANNVDELISFISSN